MNALHALVARSRGAGDARRSVRRRYGRSLISSRCSPAIMCCVRCATRWASLAASKICHGCLPLRLSACWSHSRCTARWWRSCRGPGLFPIVYHFFVANLALFWLLLTLGRRNGDRRARIFRLGQRVQPVRGGGVLVVHGRPVHAEQGKRLFGFIGAGGTAGALLGPVITIWLSVPLGPTNLLIAAMVLLEAAVFCVYRLERAATAHARAADARDAKRIGGGAFAALPELIRSPYLLGVARGSACSRSARPSLYFEQAHIVSADGAWRRRADPYICGYRSGGELAHSCDADLCYRPIAQALRHRSCGGCAARCLCRRFRCAGRVAELGRRW